MLLDYLKHRRPLANNHSLFYFSCLLISGLQCLQLFEHLGNLCALLRLLEHWIVQPENCLLEIFLDFGRIALVLAKNRHVCEPRNQINVFGLRVIYPLACPRLLVEHSLYQSRVAANLVKAKCIVAITFVFTKLSCVPVSSVAKVLKCDEP